MTMQISRPRILPRQRAAGRGADPTPTAPRPSPARSRYYLLLVPLAVLALAGPTAPAVLRFPLGALAGALAAFFVLAQIRSRAAS